MKKALGLLLAGAVVAAMAVSSSAAPKGQLKIAGSNTLLPLSQVWAETFMNKYPDASVSISGGGSGQGLAQLLNGTCNIAAASRAAKAKEIDSARTRNFKLVATKVARDGLAVIVHPSNNVKNMTIPQLGQIYGGAVKTWDKVGGVSKNRILVIGRDSSSGTYGFFQDAVLGGKAYTKDMMSNPTTQAICVAVSQSKDAIGYVGVAYAEDFASRGKVKIISISRKTGEAGMVPTVARIKSGEYPLFRFLYYYTAGSPKGLAAEFLKFCTGPEGQNLVEKGGYVAL